MTEELDRSDVKFTIRRRENGKDNLDGTVEFQIKWKNRMKRNLDEELLSS